MTEYEAWLRDRARMAREHLSRIKSIKPDDHAAIARQQAYIRRIEALIKEIANDTVPFRSRPARTHVAGHRDQR
jgi:hypothetical protein